MNSGSTRAPRRRETAWLGILALATSLWGLAPGLINGPSFDAAVFTAVGWLTRQGAVPYRDAWDHKPPSVYLTDAGAQALAPWADPWAAAWVASVVAVALSAVLVGMTVRRWTDGRTAAFTTVVAAASLAIYPVALGGGLTETFAALPMAVGCFAVVRPEAGWRAFGVAGVCVAAALGFSLLAVGMAVAMVVLALTLSGSGRFGRLAALVGGGLLVGLAAVGWLASVGGLSAAWDALVVYAGAFRAANLAWQRPGANAPAAAATLSFLFLIIPALLGVAPALRRSTPVPQLLAASAIWVAISLVSPIYLGRFETHYATILAVPMALVASLGIERLLGRGTSRPPWLMNFVVLVGLGLSLAVATAESGPLIAATRVEQHRTEVVGSYLRGGAPGRIFVWGDEPQIYALAGRQPAGRYLYLLPLTTPDYATDRLIQDLLDTWQRDPPAFVVDAGSFAPGEPGAPALLVPRPVAPQGRDLDILQPLRDFVRARYRLVTTLDGWPIYELDGAR